MSKPQPCACSGSLLLPRAEHDGEALHTHDLPQVALDQVQHRRRHRIHPDLDQHGRPLAPRTHPVGDEVASRERGEGTGQQTGISVGQQLEAHGTAQGIVGQRTHGSTFGQGFGTRQRTRLPNHGARGASPARQPGG